MSAASYSLPGLSYSEGGASSSPIKGGVSRHSLSPANARQSAKLNKFNSDAFDSSMTGARSANINALLGSDGAVQWRKSGPSRTGTCLALEACNSNRQISSKIAPLQLVWRGDEPLDKLHISMKVKVQVTAHCLRSSPLCRPA